MFYCYLLELRSCCYAHPSAHVDEVMFFFEFRIRILKVICCRSKKKFVGLEITGPYLLSKLRRIQLTLNLLKVDQGYKTTQQRDAVNIGNSLNKRKFWLRLKSKLGETLPVPFMDDCSAESLSLKETLRSTIETVLREALRVSFDVSFPGWFTLIENKNISMLTNSASSKILCHIFCTRIY